MYLPAFVLCLRTDGTPKPLSGSKKIRSEEAVTVSARDNHRARHCSRIWRVTGASRGGTIDKRNEIVLGGNICALNISRTDRRSEFTIYPSRSYSQESRSRNSDRF